MWVLGLYKLSWPANGSFVYAIIFFFFFFFFLLFIIHDLTRDNILRVRGLETIPYSSKMRETIIVMPCNGVIYGIPYR